VRVALTGRDACAAVFMMSQAEPFRAGPTVRAASGRKKIVASVGRVGRREMLGDECVPFPVSSQFVARTRLW
jgi:hypothetical protein